MSDVNEIILRGNLVADPRPSVTSSGKKVTTFRIATTRGFGEAKRTSYHNITCWEDVAEEANAKLTKGNRVQIEGRGESGSYDSRKHEGEKVYTYDIVVSRIVYLSNDDADLPTSF